ncbi:MAG: hypothetical protein IJK41_04895 [Muribaculaceae bacterium]|nr:hypothetical protein [Muribaculaceae bacterium]
MRTNFRHRPHWQLPTLLLSLALITVAATSCNKEEPLHVGYFITLDGYGMRNDKTVVILRAMQDSIHAAYPKPDMTGNDKAVIRACSNAHSYYRVNYPEFFEGFTSARLHRGWMSGTVFKSNTVIAMWNL